MLHALTDLPDYELILSGTNEGNHVRLYVDSKHTLVVAALVAVKGLHSGPGPFTETTVIVIPYAATTVGVSVAIAPDSSTHTTLRIIGAGTDLAVHTKDVADVAAAFARLR